MAIFKYTENESVGLNPPSVFHLWFQEAEAWADGKEASGCLEFSGGQQSWRQGRSLTNLQASWTFSQRCLTLEEAFYHQAGTKACLPFIEGASRLLCPWGFSRQNTGGGLPFPLLGVFPTQGWNPGLPHCRQILYHLSQQGSPAASRPLSKYLLSEFPSKSRYMSTYM